MIRRSLVLTTIVSLVLFCTAGVAGASAAVNPHKQLEDFHLKTVDSVPDGVTPFVVNNDEELLKMLQTLAENDVLRQVSVVAESIEPKNGEIGILATDVVRRTVSKSVGLGQINLVADITRYREGSFGGIIDVFAFTTFTGFTYGFDWNESYSPRYTISTDGTSTHVWVEGVLDWYLLVDGLLKLYSQPVRLDLYYSIY